MKKILLFFLIFVAGCGMKGEEVNCVINGKKAVFALKDGIITSYKIDGKSVKRSEIDEINGLYFTSAKDNSEGRAVLDEYVESIGGTCE